MLESDFSKLEASIQRLCDDNGLEIDFEFSRFPIIANIRPNEESKNQLVMDLGDRTTNFVNGEIQLVFGEDLTMRVLNDFNIEDDLLNKIKNQVKKLHYIYLQIYFKQKMKEGELING
jgi:hypothetical protein